MALINVRPTRIDRLVADEVVAHTSPAIEQAAGFLTWGADEKLLCLGAALFWLAARRASQSRRELSNHVLVCALAATVLPHIIKSVVDQERPDRKTEVGHLRGIPKSGKRYDAFPSGHAVHIGMLAGAATLLPAWGRNAVWAAGAIISATRVVMLAHWLSDVVAGLAIGGLLERMLRPVTLSRAAKARVRDNMS
jgi:membrane-associated phospholipid phosphatase